ncbi:NUDIX hydrolase [Flavobacterium microcysteis]|uniref:CoA pyrophosphatase n=1 Tax=Flavobacterium microcysteis TaxID=2596891 RepID=A0A501QMY6_9FLAO|nr:CoA pyrophosphatase [Flavobacterium microcysteis]TPD73605.1 CoA pyrophosphatase [Flavobacterium microcysteis]
MDFQAFLKYLPKIEKETLPAVEAHVKLASFERISAILDKSYDRDGLRNAAVMMLAYPKNSKTYLALILRNASTGVHSSQVALPGGKVELEDINLEATALRETFEEIGILPERIQVVRAFSEVYIPPSRFLVFPFLGISQNELTFDPSPDEVAKMIELPLEDLLDDSNLTVVPLKTSYSDEIEVPAFDLQGYIVWGATAMMLNELKETIKRVL